MHGSTAPDPALGARLRWRGDPSYFSLTVVLRARCLSSFLGLSLILSACSLVRVRGEFGEVECRNHGDDDDDDLIDCLDPDCAAHTFCRDQDGLPDAGSGMRPPTLIGEAASQDLPEPAGAAGAAGAMAVPDAGTSPSDEPDASDASPGSTPDEPDADATCEQGVDCPTPDPCQNGQCDEPQHELTRWRVSGVHVEIPLAIDGKCIDSNLECVPPLDLPPFRPCGCIPDPWVSVKVDGDEVMHTDASVNSERANWTVRTAFELASSSELRFDVMDRDVLTDEPIYSCSVSADDEGFAIGRVGCSQTFTEEGGEEVAYSVAIDVTADD